jgi:hypothetical protein
VKLLGYTPDVDPTTEGVITECSAYIPSTRGMVSAPSAQDAGLDTLAAACRGAAAVRKLDNSIRIIAGTATKLYERTGTSWTDVTRASGGDYTQGADQRWRFAQFGDVTLAACKTDTLQASSSSTFADVSGAPKADIVETVGNFVFLANTDEASFNDSPNRWWCSAIRDHTDWTPDISTQCVTNTLVATPGRINAAKRFGEQIVFYKDRSMYIGYYVGPPVVWNVQLIPGEAGCSSQDAVVDIGTLQNPVHIFMGRDDFWLFDGAKPVPIGAPIRDTVFDDLYDAYAYRVRTIHDRRNQRVYFYYPSLSGNGAVDKCVVYNYKNNKWGRDDRTIEASLEYISGGITYDTWDTVGATYDSLPTSTSYDSPFYTAGQAVPALFDTNHELMTLDGVATNSSFTTGDLGDDVNYYLLSRVKPKWLTKPSSANMTHYYKESEGDTLTTGSTVAMGSSRFDHLWSARWHRLKFDLVGDSEVADLHIEYQEDGSE